MSQAHELRTEMPILTHQALQNPLPFIPLADLRLRSPQQVRWRTHTRTRPLRLPHPPCTQYNILALLPCQKRIKVRHTILIITTNTIVTIILRVVKAVKIGINYTGTREELRGCVNDAKNVRKFLMRHFNYKSEDIVLLTDDATDSRLIPTKQNMLNAMHWLVHNAHPHDALFFHYSGHGSQVKDEDGDEPDGFDEVIFPLDFRSKGVITDDLMHNLMYDAKERSITRKPGLQVTEAFVKAKSTNAEVISWSGCKDDQTSADTYENGVATGAMSYAFMTCLRENPHQSYHRLLRNIRAMLKDKYKQKPQLSSSHHIDISKEFFM
ncbi:hypothetical protein EIP86_002174 [Pleurotus ostreatoroseus]|nr:hypothetical protein EIP86_002174 [Pleurotus ostreatoroseus]